MRTRFRTTRLTAIGTLCLIATVSFARPHNDPAHRSALPVTLTRTDGTQQTAILHGVGCKESICSRVRVHEWRWDSFWLDDLASIRQISGGRSGPLQVVIGLKNGGQRPATVIETNRILYVTDGHGRSRTVDLGTLTQVDFNQKSGLTLDFSRGAVSSLRPASQSVPNDLLESGDFTNTSHDHAGVRRRLASLNPARSMIRIISDGGWTNARNGLPLRRRIAFSSQIPSLTNHRSLG